MKLNYGDIAAQKVSERIASPVASLSELKAIPATGRVPGMLAVLTDGSVFRFHGTSALTGDDLLVVAPTAGSGRWLRTVGAVDLKMPFTYQTGDAAALLTLQAGQVLKVDDFLWEVVQGLTGGTGSAIGLSSNKTTPTNWSTKGDLLGGATGEVTATLGTAGIKPGTIGTDMDTVAKRRGLILVAADVVRFDKITDAFTAGSGYAHLVGTLISNAGA